MDQLHGVVKMDIEGVMAYIRLINGHLRDSNVGLAQNTIQEMETKLRKYGLTSVQHLEQSAGGHDDESNKQT